MNGAVFAALLACGLAALAACERRAPAEAVTEVQSSAPSATQAHVWPSTGKAPRPVRREPMAVTELLQGDSRLIALSEDEEAWLRRHHFPRAADRERLSTLTMTELERLAGSARDPVAAAVLGDRHLAQGDLRAALSSYGLSAHLGSLYGREQQGLVMFMEGVRRHGDSTDGRLMLVAHFRTMRALGDHRVDPLERAYAAGLDGTWHQRAIELQMQEFLRQIESDRAVRKLPPLVVDERPNQARWTGLARGVEATVEVYR